MENESKLGVVATIIVGAVLFLFCCLVVYMVFGDFFGILFSPSPDIGDEQGKVVVLWREINPPPGVCGPCFAYFQQRQQGVFYVYSYSGVYCQP